MTEVLERISAQGLEESPLSQNVIDYLMSQKRESSFLDFKKIIHITKDALNDFPKLVKDAIGFSNNGGGYILIGFEQNDHSDKSLKGKYIPIGIPSDFSIDQASLQEKINSYLNYPLTIDYLEFEHKVHIGKNDFEKRRFAIIYFPPSPDVILPIKDGDYVVQTTPDDKKSKKAFKIGDAIIRRGTQNAMASQFEIDWIRRRAKDHNYRLSVLSGRVDQVEETLFSNLFEFKEIPKYIWRAASKYDSYPEIGKVLRQKAPDVSHYVIRCKLWNTQIVSFVDLRDRQNEYHSLIREDSTPTQELVSDWLADKDKRRIIIELLKYEIFSFANNRRQLFFDGKTKKLFYPAFENESRKVEWPTRYKGVSSRIVANKMYSPKLSEYVYWHVAVKPDIQTLEDRMYLTLYPTMVITSDGRHPKEGPDQGAVITSLQYDTFNNSYLNTLLFWAKKLSDGAEEITLPIGIIVSANPVSTKLQSGIRWDIPATEIKDLIESHESDVDDFEIELDEEDGENEF